MSSRNITILTREPLQENAPSLFIMALKQPRHFLHLLLLRRRLGGHPAVTASLINGLKRLNIAYNYDPLITKKICKNVIVLSGIGALEKCIKLKQKGTIDLLLAGPNMVVHADEHECIVGSKEIDRLLIPSDWVKTAYEMECKETVGKIFIWPSGINQKDWTPKENSKNTILLYKKADSKDLPKDFYIILNAYLRKTGFDVVELNYGDYSKRDYKQILNQCLAMVYVATTESQGIALLESWTMNVPTLVWESGAREINGRKYSSTSTAPYLTKETGFFWNNPEELGNLINLLDITKLKPRDWVEKNMTNDITSKNLITEIEKLLKSPI